MKLQKLRERYIIGQNELGRGAFATVFPGRDLVTGQFVAIKQINAEKHKDMMERIDQEIQVHSSLVNQHIVKLIDNFADKDSLYIVTELCEFGDLENFVHRFPDNILPEDVARLFSFQILLGFLALVDQKLIHRDMKLQNILLSKDFECKVADFGFAKSRNDLGQSQAGSPITMAPEVLQNNAYNHQCDVWSFGCIVYAMTHGYYPFVPKNNGGRAELERLILQRNIHFDNPLISQECKNFINKTLQLKPEDRITWEQMFTEPWFAACTESYSKQVISQHLSAITYKELHLNPYFALKFGYELKHFVQSSLAPLSNALNFSYQLISKKPVSQQSTVEKKLLYIISLLIARMCTSTFKFSYNEKSNNLPLPQAIIQELKNILPNESINKADWIIQRNKVDVTPILHSLKTHLLDLASAELIKEPSKIMIIVSLIDLLTKEELSFPFNITLNTNDSNFRVVTEDLQNISIQEAYLHCDENVIQDYYMEITKQKTIPLVFVSQSDPSIVSERSNLVLLKELIQQQEIQTDERL